MMIASLKFNTAYQETYWPVDAKCDHRSLFQFNSMEQIILFKGGQNCMSVVLSLCSFQIK